MKKHILFVSIALFSLVSFAHTLTKIEKKQVKRDGETKMVVVQNFWSGEYPNPVPALREKTTVTG